MNNYAQAQSTIEEFENKSKRAKRLFPKYTSDEITLGHAREFVAQIEGFKSWNHMLAEVKGDIFSQGVPVPVMSRKVASFVLDSGNNSICSVCGSEFKLNNFQYVLPEADYPNNTICDGCLKEHHPSLLNTYGGDVYMCIFSMKNGERGENFFFRIDKDLETFTTGSLAIMASYTMYANGNLTWVAESLIEQRPEVKKALDLAREKGDVFCTFAQNLDGTSQGLDIDNRFRSKPDVHSVIKRAYSDAWSSRNNTTTFKEAQRHRLVSILTGGPQGDMLMLGQEQNHAAPGGRFGDIYYNHVRAINSASSTIGYFEDILCHLGSISSLNRSMKQLTMMLDTVSSGRIHVMLDRDHKGNFEGYRVIDSEGNLARAVNVTQIELDLAGSLKDFVWFLTTFNYVKTDKCPSDMFGLDIEVGLRAFLKGNKPNTLYCEELDIVEVRCTSDGKSFKVYIEDPAGGNLPVQVSPDQIAVTQYANDYKCFSCGEEWVDVWTCACDDECPECGETNSPYDSDVATPDDYELTGELPRNYNTIG